VAVNRELIILYWHIGNAIWKRQQDQAWGAKVIEQLSRDLHAAFPYMKGFSPRNLQYMRTFA
jgi:predicted nuclease of restriction endonuclease-like (RecB) superfamily